MLKRGELKGAGDFFSGIATLSRAQKICILVF
jgi:hypothetical protein